MTTMQLYWILKLDSIVYLLDAFAAIAVIVFLVSSGAFFYLRYFCRIDMAKERENADACKITRLICLISLLWIPLLVSKAMVPTTRDIAVMYVVPRVVNNERIQQLPYKLLNLAEDWIEGLKPETRKVERK